MSLKKTIIINASSSWANMGVSIVVGLLLVPIILTTLGVEKFGVWSLIAYGLTYPMILQGALALAINRFVAYFREDEKKLNSFVSSSFLIFIILAFLTITAAIIFSFFLTDIFASIPLSLKKDAQIVCILVGFTLAAKMIEATFSGALMGMQMYVWTNGIIIINDSMRAVLTIVFLVFWKSIIAVQIAFLIASSVSALLMYIVAKKRISFLRINILQIRKKDLLELLRYTLHSIARSGSTIVIQNTVLLLVGWRGTARDITVFTIAFRLPTFIRGFTTSAQNVFLPAVASLCASKQFEKVKYLAKKGTHLSCVLTFISCSLLFFFAKDILSLWLRGEVPSGTAIVMQIVIISMLPSCFEIWLPVLVGMGHLKALTIASMATAVGVIGLALILLLFGPLSVPMAPALSLAIMFWIKTGFWLPMYGISKIGIKFLEYFSQALFTSLICLLLSISGLLLVKNISFVNTIHWFIAFVFSSLMVVSIFAVISLPEEMKNIFTLIKTKIVKSEL